MILLINFCSAPHWTLINTLANMQCAMCKDLVAVLNMFMFEYYFYLHYIAVIQRNFKNLNPTFSCYF